jgi:hypothetical protein
MIILYGTYFLENPVREGEGYCYPAIVCYCIGTETTQHSMGTRITTGRRNSLRFKAVTFMHPCIYHMASCKRKTAPANTNSQNEMENNQADGRAATTKEDLTHGETKSAQN